MKDTGGSAFPTPDTPYPNGLVKQGEPGMTLRDYFAAAALQGLMAGSLNTDDCDAIAKDCYLLADAMIQERSK